MPCCVPRRISSSLYVVLGCLCGSLTPYRMPRQGTGLAGSAHSKRENSAAHTVQVWWHADNSAIHGAHGFFEAKPWNDQAVLQSHFVACAATHTLLACVLSQDCPSSEFDSRGSCFAHATNLFHIFMQFHHRKAVMHVHRCNSQERKPAAACIFAHVSGIILPSARHVAIFCS